MAAADLISADVFDTVLHRRCTTPDGVFEQAFAVLAPPCPRSMAEVFVQHRQLAEMAARKAAQDRHGAPEATIAEIYDHFPVTVFGLRDADRPRLVAAEFAAERDLCHANRALVERLRRRRRDGARIGLVSDTYWGADRLAALVRGCVPDLDWDFVYASCDHRRGKTGGLFPIMLAQQGMTADRCVHLGDNPVTDIQAARRAGLHTVHLPQATAELAAVLQRESAVFRLFCGWNGGSGRLDGGARTARRAIAADHDHDDDHLRDSGSHDPAFAYGVGVLGPLLTAFDQFVAGRVERLDWDGGRVAVAFVGRDGLAPLETWRVRHDRPAAYVEVNRRVALLAAGGDLAERSPRLRTYFDHLAGGDMTTDAARTGLLAHLRAAIDGFDHLTDLVLVDLGYCGTVQKALRHVLTAAGLPMRLHGLYLLTSDQDLDGPANGDSAEGLLSDRVLQPQAKVAVLSNMGLIEQLCGDGRGTVRDHGADGGVRREPDQRPPEQHALCARVRAGALAHARRLTAANGPAADAAWAGAILARAVLLPTAGETALLGGMRRDVNLGSDTVAALFDPDASAAIVAAKSLPAAFAPHDPPAWMAAGLGAVSPLHAYLCAVNAAQGLPAEMVGETPCGNAVLTLVADHGATAVTATVLRTATGEIRLRLPLRRADAIAAVAVPAAALPRRGVVRAITVQDGDTVTQAMHAARPRMVSPATLGAAGMAMDRGVYEVTDADGHLLLPVAPPRGDIAVLTLTVLALAD